MEEVKVTTPVLSNNGELEYTAGNPAALCAVCCDEETTIAWTQSGISKLPEPVCFYCACTRVTAYRPRNPQALDDTLRLA